MSEFRIAKLEALLARVVERGAQPRQAVTAIALAAVAAAPEPAAPVAAPAPAAPVATAPAEHPFSARGVATTPPPPPVAVPEVSIPRQPVLASVTEAPAAGIDDFQESTHVSRASGPALVPSAAESHARIASTPRTDEAEAAFVARDEPAPVSSERTVDASVEADADSAAAPPESTRQLATIPPSTQARTSVRPSVMPDSAPRSVGNPVITRGTLPPDANEAVEFRGELPKNPARTVGELLDASLAL